MKNSFNTVLKHFLVKVLIIFVRAERNIQKSNCQVLFFIANNLLYLHLNPKFYMLRNVTISYEIFIFCHLHNGNEYSFVFTFLNGKTY